MAIKEITDQTFDQTVKNGLVLVDFWAPWCGPCRTLAPILEELAGQTDSYLTIAKLNVDESPATAQRFGIRGIPTLKLFKNGNEVGTVVGIQPLEELKKWVEQFK
ncbi:thioredoxin [Thermoflavimicrobium dichotomicum]|uniref:Thioredoxin n=1 Tax=Thermoflavimicrobium dichotomicum TaxID=46223 RepID=A0A1I3U8B1_9BACL|nr:thioredoxin [Thermoflavimicrobium dichotomicum]SFJ79250.1 thioredoxin 1 [Thermoflavimicrobium dichotomicum]